MIESMPGALFVLTTAAAIALGFLVVWSRRRLALRVMATVLSAILVSLFGASIVELLGRPKPVRLEWVERQGADADVLGSRLVEGKAIYLWLGFPGEPEPRAYVLPWNPETAKELQKAIEEAAKDGGQARARLPFEESWEKREPKFYALPQPKLPDKPSSPPPLHYERRGGNA
jgi:hypothetical protein